MIASSPSPQPSAPCRSLASHAGRLIVLLAALSLGSCSFLMDEFTWLDKAGPTSEPQLVVPIGTSARH